METRIISLSDAFKYFTIEDGGIGSQEKSTVQFLLRGTGSWQRTAELCSKRLQTKNCVKQRFARELKTTIDSISVSLLVLNGKPVIENIPTLQPSGTPQKIVKVLISLNAPAHLQKSSSASFNELFANYRVEDIALSSGGDPAFYLLLSQRMTLEEAKAKVDREFHADFAHQSTVSFSWHFRRSLGPWRILLTLGHGKKEAETLKKVTGQSKPTGIIKLLMSFRLKDG
jgi:hypothetical protein